MASSHRVRNPLFVQIASIETYRGTGQCGKGRGELMTWMKRVALSENEHPECCGVLLCILFSIIALLT